MEWFTFIAYGLAGTLLFYYIGVIILALFFRFLIDKVFSR